MTDEGRSFWLSSDAPPVLHRYYSSDELQLRAMAESFRPDDPSSTCVTTSSGVTISTAPSSVLVTCTTSAERSLDHPATTASVDASNFSVISSAFGQAAPDVHVANLFTTHQVPALSASGAPLHGFPALSAHVASVTASLAGPRPALDNSAHSGLSAGAHPGLSAYHRMPALSVYPGFSAHNVPSGLF